MGIKMGKLMDSIIFSLKVMLRILFCMLIVACCLYLGAWVGKLSDYPFLGELTGLFLSIFIFVVLVNYSES